MNPLSVVVAALVAGSFGLLTGIITTSMVLLAGFRSDTIKILVDLGEDRSRRITELEQEVSQCESKRQSDRAEWMQEYKKFQDQIDVLKDIIAKRDHGSG